MPVCQSLHSVVAFHNAQDHSESYAFITLDVLTIWQCLHVQCATLFNIIRQGDCILLVHAITASFARLEWRQCPGCRAVENDEFKSFPKRKYHRQGDHFPIIVPKSTTTPPASSDLRLSRVSSVLWLHGDELLGQIRSASVLFSWILFSSGAIRAILSICYVDSKDLSNKDGLVRFPPCTEYCHRQTLIAWTNKMYVQEGRSTTQKYTKLYFGTSNIGASISPDMLSRHGIC